MFKVALKNILGHKLRTLFVAVAVALGVAFMAGTFVLTDTVASSFDTIFTEAYAGIDAQVRGEAPFEAGAQDGGSPRPDVDPALVDTVAAVDGVAEAAPVVQSFAAPLDEDGGPVTQGGAPSFGANWTGNPAIDVFTVEEGREPEGDGEAVVDTRTAELGSFAVGDTIGVQTLKGRVDLELVGIAKYGRSGTTAGASFVLMDTPAAIDTFTLSGSIQGIAVIGEEGRTEQQMVDAVAPVLPDGVEVITATEAADEIKDQLGSLIGTLQTLLNVFAAIALAAGAFLIYNTFGIVIGQRVRELALLRALGASRRQVLASVMAESFVIGVVASLLGLVGGVVLALGLQVLLAAVGLGESDSTPVIAPRTIVASIVVGTLTAVLCALAPALRASRVPPLAALRSVAVEDTGRSKVRMGIGGVLLLLGLAGMAIGSQGAGTGALSQAAGGTVVAFAGLVVLGPILAPQLITVLGIPLLPFGIAGTLGRDNARRSPKRSAGTASALMLAVTLITFISVVSLSFGKSINAATDEFFMGDLEISGAGFGFPSIGPDLVDTLADSDDVAAVSGVQRGIVEVDGSTRPVYGVRFSDVPQIFDLGETEGDLAGLADDEIAVDLETATDESWSIGDEVPVTYPNGETGAVTIGAIYDNGGIIAQNSDGHVLVSDALIREFFPEAGQQLLRVDVTAADGVGLGELRGVVEDATEAYPTAKVRDVEQIKEDNNRQLLTSLLIFFALLGLALVIGALGVAITLALSVFERTREIGLLRAVGTTRRQLVTAITGEAIVVTMLGTVLGLALGTLGGVATFRTLAEDFDTLRIAVEPVFIIGVLILAIVIGVFASLIPGFRATRLDVLDAITVE